MTPLALLMHREIRKIQPTATLKEAAQMMRDHQVGSLLVEEGGEYIGIVSETDFVRRAMAEGRNPESASVRDIMSRPLISLDIGKSAKDANEIMANRRIRHLAITEHGKVVGVISVRDLVIYFKNRL